jgi:WD40 repeat protein
MVASCCCSNAPGSLDDVRELRKRFQKTVFGFSLVEPQFESLLAFKPGLGAETGVGLAGVFQLLDNDHDGRIDGLELMGGLALCCKGSFEEKARFCFELYDFNLNATLSKPELVMMMQTSMCGLIILTGGGESAEPPLTLLETLAEEAFVCADLDRSGSIGFTEFVDWARSSREVMTCVERLSRVASMPPTATLSDDPDSADEASTTDYESDEELEAEEDITRVAAGGDEFMSVKPWLGAIKEPTAWKGSSAGTQEPGSNLQLSWVHGYSSRTCGSNLHVLSNGSIVYPAAALAVVYDPASHAQKFYAGHSGEVISLRVHPRGHVVATGEAGKVPSVHVWDSRTLECLAVLEGFHARGVNLLAFSPDGERLMTAGLDDNHSLALYEWAAAGKSSAGKSAALLATGKGHRNPLHALEFAPDGQRAWAVGVKCIRHFKQDGRSLTSKAAILGKAGTIQAFHSVGFVGRDAVVGCASGELYRFQEDGRLGQTVAAHPAGESVLSLAPSPATGGLFSGAKDGTVMTWDSSLKQVGPTVDLMEDLDGDGRADHGSLNAAVVSVSCASDAAGTPRSGTSGSRFVVGTRSGDIFEVVVPSNATSHPQVSRLATAHANGEVGACRLMT